MSFSGGEQYHYGNYNTVMPSHEGHDVSHGGHAVAPSCDDKTYICDGTTYDYPHDASCKTAPSVAAELTCYNETNGGIADEVCSSGC